MHLGHLGKDIHAIPHDQLGCGALHLGRDPLGQYHTKLFTTLIKPVDKSLAGQNGCGSNGIVRLSLGALIKLDLATILQQRFLKHPGIGKFIRKSPGTVRHPQTEIFNNPRMAPGKETVEISNGSVELIVFFRLDDDDFGGCPRFPNSRRQIPDLLIAPNPLAVLNSRIPQVPGEVAIEIDSGNHQRAKEIALAALIDAEVGLKLLGSMNLLITKAGLSEDFRLQHKGDEILQAPPLQHGLWAFLIHGNRELLLARRIERVRLLLKAKPPLIKEGSELFGLCQRQRVCLGMERGRHGKLAVLTTVPYERFVDKEKRKLKIIPRTKSAERIPPHATLLRWHKAHGRHELPWRKSHDPYQVLVSEFMLQQTTVATVKPRFEAWMQRFPTLRELASADEEAVLKEWQGLGYYSRARRLHAAARAIVELHAGIIPRYKNDLLNLPGVGEYTAAAILAFAYDLPAIVLDTNITRVIVRWSNLTLAIDTALGKEALQKVSGIFFRSAKPRAIASALMDLGATICVSGKPQCRECPLENSCRAEVPEALPKKSPRAVTIKRTEHRAWIFQRGKLFLELSPGPLWQGLWILPMLSGKASGRAVAQITYPITRYRVLMKLYPVAGDPDTLLKGFTPEELASIAIPSPHRRAIAAAANTSHTGK